ncbi:MAG: ABC transporter ATP-binding protein [Treponema sp.]|nr:ABC transporter ATP-binding protein [Treponema sp.]
MAERASLSLEHLKFSFGSTDAVNDISLEVQPGSFTTLLGPSGCGKTTLLRLISGFLEPDSGTVKINGIDQKGIAPDKRKVGMVFQDYALFPHLSVEQNLLYGLKIQRKPKDEAFALIHQTARLLGIANLLERYPHELSGGQQQRVALGRALVLKPLILLMDEPLSSLDAKLRALVREELQDIQRDFGITTVYVTHDQEEALSLSDTIAVINHGVLQQTGTPQDVYFTPKNKFVADFVGRANFIESDGKTKMIRPEWISLRPSSANESVVQDADMELSGVVIASAFLGENIRYRIKCEAVAGGIAVVDVRTNSGAVIAGGTSVSLIVHKLYEL